MTALWFGQRQLEWRVRGSDERSFTTWFLHNSSILLPWYSNTEK
jgi:hypothetical protein